MNTHLSNTSNSPLSAASFFSIITRQLRLFLLVAILAGIIGFVYATFQKPLYKSRLTFSLNDNSGGKMAGLASLASQFGLNIGDSKEMFSGDNIMEILKSRRMIEKVLLSTDTFNGKPYKMIEYYLELSSKSKKSSNQDLFPVNQLRSTFTNDQKRLLYQVYIDFYTGLLKIKRPNRNLDLFEVNVYSKDEKFSKDFTDKIVKETSLFYTEIRNTKAKLTLDALESRAVNIKGDLDNSIDQKAINQDANINPAFSKSLLPAVKQQANIQTYGVAYTELYKSLEIARLEYLNETPLIQIVDEAEYPMDIDRTALITTTILFIIVSQVLLFSILLFIFIKRHS